MYVSYKKLWKLLIDKDMKKKDLVSASGISTTSLSRLGRNENVTTDVLVKICEALDCDIFDIMELVHHNNKYVAETGRLDAPSPKVHVG